MTTQVQLTEEPLNAEQVEAVVAHPGAGAVVVFVGQVRNENEGRSVTELEYQAYEPMAVKEMQRIVESLLQRFPETRLAIHHRIGRLRVGDIAVVCAASSPHRREAFLACSTLIDEVKSQVPIWKRESGPDGPYWVGWVDARCYHGAELERGHDASGTNETGHQHGTRCHHHSSPPLSLPNGLCATSITVSDTRRGASDTSGALAERLLAAAGLSVERRWVSDEQSQIAAAIQEAVERGDHLVFLTGGTGIGPRDVTYETLAPLLDRRLDGFGEEFRRLSVAQIGPRALLSRAIGGVMARSFVLAVPGSPKAVDLALSALIIPLLQHSVAMMAGSGH